MNSIDSAGWPPLHEAAHYGESSIVQLLLVNGAQADEQTR